MFKINRFALAALAVVIGTASAADKAVVKQNFLRSVAGVQNEDGRRLQIAGCSCQEFENCGPVIKENLQYSLLAQGQIQNTQVYKDQVNKEQMVIGGKELNLKQLERIEKTIIKGIDCIKVKHELVKEEAYEEFQVKFLTSNNQIQETDFTLKEASMVIKDIADKQKIVGIHGKPIAGDKEYVDRVTGKPVVEYHEHVLLDQNDKKLVVQVVEKESSTNFAPEKTYTLSANTKKIISEIIKPPIEQGGPGLCPCGCGDFTDPNTGTAYKCDCLGSCTDASAGNPAQSDFSCDADIAGGNKCPSPSVCCCTDGPFAEVCTYTPPP